MSSHVGHAIQKIMQNVPVSISVSDNTATVVTNGGGAVQSGFIGGRVQSQFRELSVSASVGTVLDAQTTESCVYVLNTDGSVFGCYSNGGISEVYIPTACNGYAKKIAAGRDHLLIWTDKSKVFGVGCNNNYQLVPQGQCRYDYATEILITDYLTHNNSCAATFGGAIAELNSPVLNGGTLTCGKATFVKQDTQQVYLGNLLTVTNVGYAATNANNAPVTNGTLSLPLYADIRYSGFIGVDSNGVASGLISYEASGIYTYTPHNSMDSTGTFAPAVGAAFSVNNSVEDKLILTNSIIVGSASVAGVCGAAVQIPLDTLLNGVLTVGTNLVAVPGANPGANQQSVLSLTLVSNVNPLDVLGLTTVALINGNYTGNSGGVSTATVTGTPSFPVNLECCESACCASGPNSLPQKCWKNIFAGFDLSVLLDDCNGMFVLGTIHKVRDNSWFLKKNCLQDILNQAVTTVTLPASEINCSSSSSSCGGCASTQKMNTDLNRIGVQLSFDPSNNYNFCDFLQNLQNCNGVANCADTCTSCDTSIYLDIEAVGSNPCDSLPLIQVSNVVVYNKASLCKQIANFSTSTLTLNVQYSTIAITADSILDFNANRYCIDGHDLGIDRPLMLTTPFVGGSTVVIYVDISNPGGVRFATPSGRTNNVRFIGYTSPSLSSTMTFGGVLDPVVLTNLKMVLSAFPSAFCCRAYRNPPLVRLYSTYLQGGDCVCFSENTGTQRLTHAVTADLPTLFRLNRSITQVGVGNNSLSVLSGSLACPSDVLAIGVNCNGQLGVGTRQNAITWQTVNRCYFPCPVTSIFGGDSVTFYLTQGGCVLASGKWKCLTDSLVPTLVAAIPAGWRTKKIAVGRRSLLLLGHDGGVYGMGENLVGELGTGNTSCVTRPVPLNCQSSMSIVSRQIASGMRHPVERSVACCSPCASSCSSSEEPVTYTRHARTTRSGKYVPNNRISLSQRYNK